MKPVIIIAIAIVFGIGIGLSINVSAKEGLIPSWIKSTAVLPNKNSSSYFGLIFKNCKYKWEFHKLEDITRNRVMNIC